MSAVPSGEARVAVLADCDNVAVEALEHALRVVAQFGRIVLRRGYGNQATLGKAWQETLVDLAFTPCLQYTYVKGKNTADIALALDALEALFDHRADIFCLVTSDSDFSYLCRKLRERGATVYIVGEPKTPGALRNASDQFFEWSKPESPVEVPPGTAEKAGTGQKVETSRTDPPRPKRRPKSIVEAVTLLASDTSEGQVNLSALGSYLRRSDPAFSPKAYGHSGLLDMVKTYDHLSVSRAEGGGWLVGLASAKAEGLV